MYKTLIEDGTFDLVKLFYLVGEEARKEKNAIPPINEILYWWTRKPLIVARLVALASTMKNINDMKELLGVNNDKRAYLRIPNSNLYKKNLELDPSKIKVLDPFGGAGNLIFEAKRLGLDCFISDCNPVAYLIQRSILEYPAKYGEKLAEDVENYGKELINKVDRDIGKFFHREGKKSLSFLWAWCIICPYCKQRVPLVNQMWILNTPKKKIGVRFKLTEDLDFKVELLNDMNEKEGESFTQKKGKAICIKCRSSIDYEHITTDIANRHDREMLAIVVQNINGKDYEPPTIEDRKKYIESSIFLKDKWKEYEEKQLIPNEDIKARSVGINPLWSYGIKKWNQFFSERQLLVMLTISKNIQEICDNIDNKEYSKVIATYLSFILSKHVQYNAIGIRWHYSAQKIGDALSFRQARLIYNHAEVNPLEKTSGSLMGIISDVVKSIRFATGSKNFCNVFYESVLHVSQKITSKFDLIITDPPYADDVQYGELSEIFYVWLYRILKKYYPELPSLVPLDEDLCISVGRFGSVQLANDFYEKGMKQAFRQLNFLLKDDGLLVLFFAHSSTKAWNLLLEVLRESKFKVVSSYAVHTENPSNTLAKGKTSFMSSIVVACRKIKEDKMAYFEDIVPEIEDKVKNILKNLSVEELIELPITDLLIMTYGKVLEESTQHTILKSYRTDFQPKFENVIKDAREFILKEIITKLTGRSPTTLGSDMSFYIIAKAFYRGILDSNEAIKVAWAYSVKLEDLERRQVIGKNLGNTNLLFFDEIHSKKKAHEIDRNNLHEQLLYLENIANVEGLAGVNRIVSQNNNFKVHELKQIVNLLLKSYRIRLNKIDSLTGKEQKELKILEGLADTFNSSNPSTGKGTTLEGYMG